MKPSELVQRAITEHAAVSEFVRNLDETVAIWKAKEVDDKINAIRAFLQKHVTDHFAYEDETIFSNMYWYYGQQDLKAAQDELKDLVTARQEATLVTMGVLE